MRPANADFLKGILLQFGCAYPCARWAQALVIYRALNHGRTPSKNPAQSSQPLVYHMVDQS
jgi:hypothetical protein